MDAPNAQENPNYPRAYAGLYQLEIRLGQSRIVASTMENMCSVQFSVLHYHLSSLRLRSVPNPALTSPRPPCYTVATWSIT